MLAEVNFPELRLKHGIQKSVIDPISITGNGAREVRRRINSSDRFMWTLPARLLLEEDKAAIYEFVYNSLSAPQDSFYFRDPTYPSFSGLMRTRGSPTALNKWFTVPTTFLTLTTGRHTMWSAASTTIRNQFKYYRTDTNAEIFPTAISYDSTTGAPYATFSASDVVGPNYRVRFEGPLYFPVRLNGSLQWSIETMIKDGDDPCDVVPQIIQMNDFQLIEVFEKPNA